MVQIHSYESFANQHSDAGIHRHQLLYSSVLLKGVAGGHHDGYYTDSMLSFMSGEITMETWLD